jgi:hypothetical protein
VFLRRLKYISVVPQLESICGSMAGMHNKDIMILCCYCVILVTLGVVIREEYFNSESDGKKSKKLRLRAYGVMAIAWAVAAVVQLTKIRW